MRSEKWGQVKVGSYLIFADQYEGVFKALVKDVDIRIRDVEEPGGYSYPYGLTADSGTVEVDLEGERRIMNLAYLIPWSPGHYSSLSKQWGEIVALRGQVSEKVEVYNAGVRLLKAA